MPGIQRNLERDFEIFSFGKNIIYFLFDPQIGETTAKIGLSRFGARRFLTYNLNFTGIRFHAIFVVKDFQILYKSEHKFKEICDGFGNRIMTNKCRASRQWVEWFNFGNMKSLHNARDNFYKYLVSEKILVASQFFKEGKKLRVRRARKSKNVIMPLNPEFQLSEENDRANQVQNFETALPIATLDAGFIYIVSDDVEDEKEEDPEVVYKYGYTFNIGERFMNYSICQPEGPKIHCIVAVKPDLDLISIESSLRKFLLRTGQVFEEIPYRDTKNEFIKTAQIYDDMQKFIDLLDQKGVLLRAQLFNRGRGGVYADPNMPKTNYIQPTKHAREAYKTRFGRKIKQVRTKTKRAQLENRELDSILRTRDWLGTQTKKLKETRKKQDANELYTRAWMLIRTKFMKNGFDINLFFRNEHVIEQYLKIMHEINMSFHRKNKKRLAKFEKTKHYDSMKNMTARERKTKYTEKKQSFEKNRHLAYLVEIRDWKFILAKGRRLYLTSRPRSGKLLAECRGFYRNCRDEVGKELIKKHKVKTFKTLIEDVN